MLTLASGVSTNDKEQQINIVGQDKHPVTSLMPKFIPSFVLIILTIVLTILTKLNHPN